MRNFLSAFGNKAQEALGAKNSERDSSGFSPGRMSIANKIEERRQNIRSKKATIIKMRSQRNSKKFSGFSGTLQPVDTEEAEINPLADNRINPVLSTKADEEEGISNSYQANFLSRENSLNLFLS